MKFSYWLGHLLFRNLARGLFDYRVIGLENVPEGGALLVCNHESFLDPPFVGSAFDFEIHYLARKSLMSNPLAKAIYRAWNSIPVDQDKPDMSSLKACIKLLKQREKVLIFPEGARSATGVLQKGAPGVGLIVSKAQVPVVPMRIFGTYAAMPIGASFFRPAEITLVIGKPWQYDPARYNVTGKDLYQRLSDDLLVEIGALRN